jgi:hypothetical protein
VTSRCKLCLFGVFLNFKHVKQPLQSVPVATPNPASSNKKKRTKRSLLVSAAGWSNPPDGQHCPLRTYHFQGRRNTAFIFNDFETVKKDKF